MHIKESGEPGLNDLEICLMLSENDPSIFPAITRAESINIIYYRLIQNPFTIPPSPTRPWPLDPPRNANN